MKANTNKRLVLAALISAVIGQAQAQSTTATNSSDEFLYTGYFAASLFYYNYNDSRDFLQRYNYREGYGDNNSSGFYADASFRVVGSNSERDVFVLERDGFGIYNNRNRARYDSDNIGVTGYYNSYRSATGTLGYQYNPSRVPGGVDRSYFFPAGTNTNSGYVAQFNNDSDRSNYRIDRDTYGAGLKFKPALFNDAAALGLKYDGYSREGDRFSSYVLGGSNVTGGASRVLQRWRGFDNPVNEEMNRATISASGSPNDFHLSYEGSVEKFNNQASEVQISDFSYNSPALVPSPNPLFFTPDSTLVNNNFKLSKVFGSTSIAAGYGLSVLDQDSFSTQQQTVGYNDGQIETNNAYLTVSSAAFSSFGLEGYVKYYDRENDSDFPVTGLINPTADQQLGVRINSIESYTYGVSANFRPDFWRSNLIAGWRRLDRDRDLTWTAVTVPGRNGIQPQRSLYSEKSLIDEFYMNFVARPATGVMLRISPSYASADDTGLITEPGEAFILKTSASYAAPDGWMLSGYYNYKDRSNDNKVFTDALTNPVADGGLTAQNVDSTQQSAGFTFNKPFGEWVNMSANFGWVQNDFETYFIQSSRRRFEAPNNPVLFLRQNRPNYDVDTYFFSIGGDWQARETLRFNGNYTYSSSSGKVANGSTIQSSLPEVDARIDNRLHSVEIGAAYSMNESMDWTATYIYDNYDDDAYGDLSGSMNSIVLGFSMAF